MKKKIFSFADLPSFQEHVRICYLAPGESISVDKNFYLVDDGALCTSSEQYGHVFYIEDDILCQEMISYTAVTDATVWEVAQEFLQELGPEGETIRTLLLEGLCKEARWAEHLLKPQNSSWKLKAAIIQFLAEMKLPWLYMLNVKLTELNLDSSDPAILEECSKLSRKRVLRCNHHQTNLRINPIHFIHFVRTEIEHFSYA
ncbi:cyclic nucleotide-binding domain-containing protein [Listeria kieliensis]|uniref:Uncharacterized protein n=1 Tax=Listeria kieliensis TaxID=1621700 RepID=A0A3D8TSP7_9LIST|nr:hypothetical protein [Listeria kieliensis]RDX00786.1 hypothetical protein UR08_07335 [Listeria kieliensis]